MQGQGDGAHGTGRPGIDRRSLVGAALALPFGAGQASAQTTGRPGGAGQERPTPHVPFGSAAMIEDFRADPRYRELLRRHCDVIVPMNELKWEALRHDRERFDFAAADELVEFARTHGKSLRGHALVWGEALPAWAKTLSAGREAERELISHIHTVVSRYRGVIPSWDVVNEVIAHDPGGRGNLRDTVWLRTVGPGYIETAFRAAAEADPSAKLVLNDYDFENPDPRTAERRAMALGIVRRLKDKGIPIHGVGFQAHLYGEREIDEEGIARFAAELKAMEVEVLVTELDVIDWRWPADPNERDRRAAALVARFLKALGSGQTPSAVVTWGMTDRYSWIHDTFKRRDTARARPLPFDEAYRPKPMWQVLEAVRAGRA